MFRRAGRGTKAARRPKLSKRVYFGLTTPGRSLPLEFWRWEIVEQTGWTLEYVDALSVGDLFEYWQIIDGRNKAEAEGRQVKTKWRKR